MLHDRKKLRHNTLHYKKDKIHYMLHVEVSLVLELLGQLGAVTCSHAHEHVLNAILCSIFMVLALIIE